MNIDGLELTILDGTGCYDYQWNEFAVMRGDDGYLYVAADSGCSYQYFGEEMTSDDLTRVASWQGAAAKAQEWTAGVTGKEATGGIQLIERLMKSRPEPFDPAAVKQQIDPGWHA